MGKIWTEQRKFETWLEIETLRLRGPCGTGRNPGEAVKEIREKASFDVQRVDEIEKETKHDVIAFLTSVGESIGPLSKYLHYGLTSSDVLDTSLALLLKEASDLILRDIHLLLGVLKEKAYQHKETLMIGRSHGVHAEPITFGLKMALWHDEMKRNLIRMERAKEAVCVGKISGAVGTFAHIPPFVEEYVCKRLGLKAAPISTQIVQRDLHAEFFTTLAIIASSIEKFAVELQASSADRGSGSRRIFLQGPERLLLHAPQAEPHLFGEPLGPGKAGTVLQYRFFGEYPSLARTRYQPFLRREGHRAGCHDSDRLHAEPLHLHRQKPHRLPGSYENQHGEDGRADLFRSRPSSAHPQGLIQGRSLCGCPEECDEGLGGRRRFQNLSFPG